ncbi:hypothetical protein, partial [Paenibacillus sp. Y412MC10]|uniref:hypothetical protein n=1 Tax=Geobacillus sp. (strain Y412MC10) TaxID=481743 RepID=UPI001643114E
GVDVREEDDEDDGGGRGFEEDIAEVGIIGEEGKAFLEGEDEFIVGKDGVGKELGEEKEDVDKGGRDEIRAWEGKRRK